MDTDSHIISGMQEDMMTLLDEVLPSGISPTSNERQRMQVHDAGQRSSDGRAAVS
ncbi:hypothetical protein ACFLYB_03710 [Chloroflexota bacterium]